MAVQVGVHCVAESPLAFDVRQFAQDQFGSEVKWGGEALQIKAVHPLLPPIATARELDFTVARDQWMIVRMKADKGQYGSLWISPKAGKWLPHATKVDHQFTFPIRADGQFHNYNVWLGDSRLMPLKRGRTYDLDSYNYPCIIYSTAHH